MFVPVKVELWRDGRMFRKFVAHQPAELNCRIEMMTGIGWLDVTPLYQTMLDNNYEQIRDMFKVCHSFEKWGGWQQEVIDGTVRLRRVRTGWFSRMQKWWLCHKRR